MEVSELSTDAKSKKHLIDFATGVTCALTIKLLQSDKLF